MTELPNDIGELKALIKELLERIAQLEAENAELRCRLGMDSSNSDKPPSSDGYKNTTVKPSLPKDKERDKGGQEGHKGATLQRVEKPDHVQVHIPEQCQGCGRHFKPEEAQVWQSRPVFDRPQPKLEVTELVGWVEGRNPAFLGFNPVPPITPPLFQRRNSLTRYQTQLVQRRNSLTRYQTQLGSVCT